MAMKGKLLEKIGDYSFDVSKIVFAALIADYAFKGITRDDVVMLCVGAFIVAVSFIFGIVLNKIGGL